MFKNAVIVRNIRIDVIQKRYRRSGHHHSISGIERTGRRWPATVVHVNVGALLRNLGSNRKVCRTVAISIGPGLTLVNTVGNFLELFNRSLLSVVHQTIAVPHYFVATVLFTQFNQTFATYTTSSKLCAKIPVESIPIANVRKVQLHYVMPFHSPIKQSGRRDHNTFLKY